MREVPACVYRFYDRADQLLYVGCTANIASRFNQHRVTTVWFPDVTSIRLEHFESKDDAALAELIAIVYEFPRYNIDGSRDRAAARLALREREAQAVA